MPVGMQTNPHQSGRTSRRPERPAAPVPPKETGDGVPRVPAQDDDAVIVPAPDPSVFAAAVVAQARAHALGRASRLGLRRTLIPILLTCGVIFPTLAALWLRLEPEDPLRAGTRPWIPVALAALGVVLLALAILNMLQVRHLLHTAKTARVDATGRRS